MYIPPHFNETDPKVAAEVMAAHPFGLLITSEHDMPVATPMPFLYRSEDGPLGTLYGHVARANPQWRAFDGARAALATFMGPHGYVSPAWYAVQPAVPTWNYVAVHATGRPRLLEAPETRIMLDRLVAHFEDGSSPWSLAALDTGYIRKMIDGIAAFAMPVEKLETKTKLGQNRARADSLGAAAELRKIGNPTLAALMEQAAKPA